ncbi:MAG: carboxypeptidase regulatory-like domain-containing protein [Planctomycetes bacterium]|nr:carboxypeptidase regulatory-like domain-containing protein [Planctomycetota bacterium]
MKVHRWYGGMLWLVAALGVLLIGDQPAMAHKLSLFATADGKTISGYGYFSGGGRPHNVTVIVTAPGSRKLGETTTNEKGEFTFPVLYKCDHILTINAPDGHSAMFTVEADELPDDLPVLSADETQVPQVEPLAPKAAAPVVPKPVAPAAAASAEEIEQAVERVVKREIRPLSKQIIKYREQLDRYEEKTSLHDVLGGIGYILGITGVAFYFLGTRKLKENRRAPRASGK